MDLDLDHDLDHLDVDTLDPEQLAWLRADTMDGYGNPVPVSA